MRYKVNAKKIILIAGSEQTREFLHSQSYEYLNQLAIIKSYAVEDDENRELDDYPIKS